MSTPSETDADRIIAAQRDEGRKTRHLIVWLLVGPTVLAGAIWGIVLLVGADQANSESGGCAISGQTVVDLKTCPLSGPMLTDSSTCAAFNTSWNVAGDPAKTNPAAYFLYQRGATDPQQINFGNQCAAVPSATLGVILDAMDLPQQPIN